MKLNKRLAQRTALILIFLIEIHSSFLVAQEVVFNSELSYEKIKIDENDEYGFYSVEKAESAFNHLALSPNMGIIFPVSGTREVFLNLWTVWTVSGAERLKFQSLSSDERKKEIFRHYGLIENPFNKDFPIGFFESNKKLAMNCLVCHTGQVGNKVVLGLPNRMIDFKSLFHDMAKLDSVGGAVLLAAAMNLGPQRGLVNMYGMEQNAMRFRDEEMNLKIVPNFWGFFNNSLVNVPAWWNIRYRTHLFADNVIPMTPRIFVSSATSILASGDTFRNYEGSVSNAFELAKSIRSPKYPFPIDQKLADDGRSIFDNKCSKCHGDYDKGGNLVYFPNKTISIEKVQTDPVRTLVTTETQRAFSFLSKGWISQGYKTKFVRVVGYLAPPLVGIWSTAPYLHNGSVTNLWELLNPKIRSRFWKESSDPSTYDFKNIGIVYQNVSKVSNEDLIRNDQKSLYYNTTEKGHAAIGHTFSEDLDEASKRAVLEFLKTL